MNIMKRTLFFILISALSIILFSARTECAYGWAKTMEQDTILFGIAEHSKAGAIVITKELQVYYIEGKAGWDDDGLHRKKIRVYGKIKTVYHSEKSLGYRDQVYKQGIAGEQKFIRQATWSEDQIAPDDPNIPAMLASLRLELPEKWEAVVNGDTLTVIRCEPVYLLSTNRINAPVNTLSKKEYEDHVKKHGRLIQSRFEFRLAPRFSNREMAVIRANNSHIENLINGLPDKHKISHLRKKGKRDALFIGRNDDENRAIVAYEIEKQELIGKIIPFPEYVTGSFAMFILAETGMDDDFSVIYPSTASDEMWKIKTDIFEKFRFQP